MDSLMVNGQSKKKLYLSRCIVRVPRYKQLLEKGEYIGASLQ